MGVIDRENRAFVGLIEDVQNDVPEAELHQPINELDENAINNAIDIAVAEEAEEEELRRVTTTKKIKTRNPVKPTSFTLRTKHIGAKKHRRYENALQMLDSVNSDDVEEISIGDFMNSRISAFSKLLEKRENLKLWNDFINCPEEKQAEVLKIDNCSCCVSVDLAAQQSSKLSGKDLNRTLNANGNNPKVCFHRISNGFRSLLKKKQVPMGVLSHLESELIEFFSNWPRSTYVSQLPNGFERLILHAICQYLDLIAESYGDKDDRHTRVENPREVFKTPPVLLTQFIERNYKQL